MRLGCEPWHCEVLLQMLDSDCLLTCFEKWPSHSRVEHRCNILEVFIELKKPTRIIQFATPGCRRRRFFGYFRPTEKS